MTHHADIYISFNLISAGFYCSIIDLLMSSGISPLEKHKEEVFWGNTLSLFVFRILSQQFIQTQSLFLFDCCL